MKINELQNYRDEKNFINLSSIPQENVIVSENIEGYHPKNWYHFEDGKVLFKETEGYGYFAEVLYSEFAKKCGISHAHYEIAKKGSIGVITPDFVKDKVYVSYRELIDRYVSIFYDQRYIINESQRHINYSTFNNLPSAIKIIKSLYGEKMSSSLRKDLLKMFTLDLLTCNSDRNSSNWGLIVGEKVKLAPLFDNEFIANMQFEASFFKRAIESILKSNGKKTINSYIDEAGFSLYHEREEMKFVDQLVEYYENTDKQARKEIENILGNFEIEGTIESVEKKTKQVLPKEVKMFIVSAMSSRKSYIEERISEIKNKENLLNGGYKTRHNL